LFADSLKQRGIKIQKKKQVVSILSEKGGGDCPGFVCFGSNFTEGGTLKRTALKNAL